MIRIKIKDPSGTWHEFIGDSKASITQQCESQGINSPFACRAGACTMCSCHVHEGREYLIQEKFGTKFIDIEDDQFLCCIGGLNDAHVDDKQMHDVVLDYSPWQG